MAGEKIDGPKNLEGGSSREPTVIHSNPFQSIPMTAPSTSELIHSIQETLESVSPHMSEGDYLTTCNALKQLFDRTAAPVQHPLGELGGTMQQFVERNPQAIRHTSGIARINVDFRTVAAQNRRARGTRTQRRTERVLPHNCQIRHNALHRPLTGIWSATNKELRVHDMHGVHVGTFKTLREFAKYIVMGGPWENYPVDTWGMFKTCIDARGWIPLRDAFPLN